MAKQRYSNLSPAVLAAFGIISGLAAPALAETTIYEQDGVKLDVGVTIGVGGFHVGNAALGAGVVNQNGSVDRNRSWAEGFIAPSALLSVDTAGAGVFYGGMRAVGVATVGDGDAAGLTSGGERRVTLDHAYAGWRSGSLFGEIAEDAVDISFGRQSFSIGDGFLIADGNFEMGREAGYWFGSRDGWQPAALVKLNAGQAHADLFRLKSDRDSGSDEIYGANLEWRWGEDNGNVVGVTGMRISDSLLPTRDGMRILSLRGQGAVIPNVPDLFLAAEYVAERNNRAGAEVDASAWYGEAAYTFSAMPWSPRIAYRYAHFSGDKDSTGKSEAFDPLHYGQIRGWGSWFQGEITGQYVGQVANTNVNAQKFELAIQPTETVTLTALYYLFHFDQKPTGVTSSHFGNELNLIVDWQAKDNLSITGALGWLDGGRGGEQLLGGSKDSMVMQVIAQLKF